MKIHERMSEKRCFYMIVFLAVILFVLSGCEKQQPESESVDSIPTINIGISARTGLSKNLSEVNQTLGDLTEEKIGVRARLIWTGLNSSQGNSYYKNRQLGVDILNIYFNQFENYRQKNLLLDMEPYMAEAAAAHGDGEIRTLDPLIGSRHTIQLHVQVLALLMLLR